MKKMKKILAITLATSSCIGLVACGEQNSKPKIEISEISEDEKRTETTKQKVEDSKKITTISNTTLNLLGDYKSSFLDVLKTNDISATVENNDDGIQVTTNKSSQREKINEQLNNKAKEFKDKFKTMGSDFTINYNLTYGYIDVYCNEAFASELPTALNQLIGIIACAEKINDNTKDWTVQVMINDSNNGESVTQIGVSDTEPFVFTSDNWKSTNSTESSLETKNSEKTEEDLENTTENDDTQSETSE